MATEADHIALANRNHNVLLHLLKDVDRFPEWVAIVAFYKAVQIAEALLRHKTGRCGHGHDDRLAKLKMHGSRDLYKHYRVLWETSCIARYLSDLDSSKPYSCFTDAVPPEKVENVIVKKRLHGFECEAIRYLGDTSQNSLHRVQELLN